MRSFWITSAIITGIITINSDANAVDSPIRQLELYQGHGLTLNFRPTQETISKIWVDDPSQVTLDFDDPSCRTTNAKQPCAAQVIHLRRIERLNFPGLPRTPTTALTVVTNRNIHQFRLTFPNSGMPRHGIINIESSSTSLPFRTVQPQYITTQQIEQGLQVALSRQFLARSDPLWRRVSLLMQLMHRGISLKQATQQAGVSIQLIQRLAELGQTKNL